MTYGCHNRPAYSRHVLVQHGWHEDTSRGHLARHPVMTTIPFTMSPDCQYTHTALGQADSGCVGCRHRAEVPASAQD